MVGLAGRVLDNVFKYWKALGTRSVCDVEVDIVKNKCVDIFFTRLKLCVIRKIEFTLTHFVHAWTRVDGWRFCETVQWNAHSNIFDRPHLYSECFCLFVSIQSSRRYDSRTTMFSPEGVGTCPFVSTAASLFHHMMHMFKAGYFRSNTLWNQLVMQPQQLAFCQRRAWFWPAKRLYN